MTENETPAERRARLRRERYHALTPEQKAARLEYNRQWQRKWREEHPEEYEAQKKEKAEKFIERYRTDPAFRERRQKYLRERYHAENERPTEG